jgi:hypothetical protein
LITNSSRQFEEEPDEEEEDWPIPDEPDNPENEP